MSRTIPSCSTTLPGTQPVLTHHQVTQAAAPSHRFRGRIGADLAGGFYPAPHRYHIHVSRGCPLSLRVSITLDLLGLEDSVTTTVITPPAATPGALAPLRSAYEATRHHYTGPLTMPALCDRWSGRIVSNHTPDILRDLADHLSGHDTDVRHRLRPPALAAQIDDLGELLDERVTEAAQRAGAAPAPHRQGEALETLLTALALIERRLASQPYALGGELTAADVDLWVTLVHLDAVHRLHLDADAVHTIAEYDRLWAYVRRLHAHSAFHGAFHADHMARSHRSTCRGPQSSGAAIPLPGVLANATA
ncbi:glutathione S-transferase C-terminal domain-containing protein [Streptomyces sp. RB6PN25]|uniref:Glutathione S-transferase C-terminal domain-containing protein n=1 Tax=Streptomyces humicola TaxID=2953240 RepID=A0ABT1PTA6_9ACTN|nr:glutathione S-transferase C-terminal domain-containing protein [Streptomyces humicola]MCQ4080907.1 glutathione S-transferase C-terminal domain-containing protein [Streptomyces humicola]